MSNMTVFNTIAEALKSGKLKAFRKEHIDLAYGYSLEELEALGIKEQQIKRLERTELVVRARLVTKRGHVNRWIFLIPDNVVPITTEPTETS